MKRLLLAITLASVLSGTALAGEMPGVGAPLTGDVPTIGSTSKSGEVPTVPPPPYPERCRVWALQSAAKLNRA